jgi:hypothetical protein
VVPEVYLRAVVRGGHLQPTRNFTSPPPIGRHTATPALRSRGGLRRVPLARTHSAAALRIRCWQWRWGRASRRRRGRRQRRRWGHGVQRTRIVGLAAAAGIDAHVVPARESVARARPAAVEDATAAVADRAAAVLPAPGVGAAGDGHTSLQRHADVVNAGPGGIVARAVERPAAAVPDTPAIREGTRVVAGKEHALVH